MSPLRLAVLVSGRGTNLEALADAIDAGRCAAQIVLVATDNPAAAALDLAEARGIERAVVPYLRGADREAWCRDLAEAVANCAPDLVVLAGFMRILSAEFVTRFEDQLINIHPSLLPAFPGKDGVGDALAAGVRVSGCTVHFVDHGVDTGPILAQAVVPVMPGDTRESLHARIQRLEHQLLPRVIDDLAHGRFDGARSAAPTTGDADVLISPRFTS